MTLVDSTPCEKIEAWTYYPPVTPHDNPEGLKAAWFCSCGAGDHGYDLLLLAASAAKEHLVKSAATP